MLIFSIIALCILRYNIYNSKGEVFIELFLRVKASIESLCCTF